MIVLNATDLYIVNESQRNDTASRDLFFGRRLELNAWLAVTGGMTFLGVIMNVLALIASWPQPMRRSSFSLLICHFVALHLFMCLINIPINVFMVLAKADGRWMPPSMCIYVQTIWGVTASLINWSDAGLSFNRFVALFFPHHYSAWTTKRANVGLIGFTWVICIATRVASAISTGVVGVLVMTPTGHCAYLPSATAGRVGVMGVYLTTVVPYAVTGIGAVLILAKSSAIYVSHRSNKIRLASGQERDAPSRALRHRLRMARTLLLTFLWTAVCNTPGYVVVYCFASSIRYLSLSGLWLRVMPPFQYGLTPCIIMLSNAEYRRRLFRITRMSQIVFLRRYSHTAPTSNRSHQQLTTN